MTKKIKTRGSIAVEALVCHKKSVGNPGGMTNKNISSIQVIGDGFGNLVIT